MTKYRQARKNKKLFNVIFFSVVGAVLLSATVLSITVWIEELSKQGIL